jgi:NAD(P)-dependent dehydrogenase (short-subunit alcohol dehydrogenase family)
LVTGGLGALGLAAAEWLAKDGAGCVVLVGRHGANAATRKCLDELQASHGCVIHTEQVDVRDAGAVKSLVNRFGREWLPLRGIIHAAGVLDDGVFTEQRWERFEKVWKPKSLGAWHLHQESLHAPLDFFVLYSSIASVLGAAGQSNYAMANGFLDGLAEHRQALGLPAVSINWGPWSDTGMASTAMARRGLGRGYRDGGLVS